MAAVSARLGLPFMPWQELVADVGGELVELSNGLVVPAYREVIVTVPRQSGKTTLVLAWGIQRAHGWGCPQRVAYSAQTGNDARKKLVEDWEPILKPRQSQLGIRRILKGMGNEAVEFRNGSRIVLMASSEESGHGPTVHLGVKDELFADSDFRRDQALVPSMATIEDAQVLTMSTAGTDDSIPLNDAVSRGRQVVLEDRREGVAYFEWSAAPDDDLGDPRTWWRFMPALGFTQSERSIMAARETLSARPGEFRRAFGNVATASDERVIPESLWFACCGPTVQPDGDVVFAVDVNLERSASSIAVADRAGRCELLEHRPMTGWVVERVVELARKWSAPVALDPAGPAGGFKAELERQVKIVDCGGRDLARACGAFFDDVVEGRAKIRSHAALDAAVSGAVKRSVGDAWVWARKGVVDVSPLMAVSMARWVSQENPSVEPWAYYG
jgi:hypothetical protein